MLIITEEDARRLRRIIIAAEMHVRERAVEQRYRSDANKYLRDRPMTDFHRDRADDAIMVAETLQGIAEILKPPPLREEPERQLRQAIPNLGLRQFDVVTEQVIVPVPYDELAPRSPPPPVMPP